MKKRLFALLSSPLLFAYCATSVFAGVNGIPFPSTCDDIGLDPYPVDDCWEIACGEEVDWGKHCGMEVKCVGEVDGQAVVSFENWPFIFIGHESNLCAGVNESWPIKDEIICTEQSGGKPDSSDRFEVEVNLTDCNF